MDQARTIRLPRSVFTGEPETVEPLGVGGVAAEPGGQAYRVAFRVLR
jgi:hypothetical protein